MEHAEKQYLDLCHQILQGGEIRNDRTGTGTLSLFVPQPMRWDLRNEIFPLLTTKRVFWRGVVEELLWFVRGDTNANNLAAKNVHIWTDNGTREFLDSRNLSHRQQGDLGPVYGFQWRHFGATYDNCCTDYTNVGVDQISEIVQQLRTDWTSRRIILSAWNPAALHEMALPPCHILAQFYVKDPSAPRGAASISLLGKHQAKRDELELCCALYQRSADVGLGVPFNIASYALLTRMLAHVTDMKVGEFIHIVGDAHIYRDHIDALAQQITRQPKDFPTLKIINAENVTKLEEFQFEHFLLQGYDPHGKLPMTMSV